MRAQDLDAGYYDPADDKYNQIRLDDTRQPRVTLKHLNRLKKMRAARQLENLVRRDTLEIMYSQPDEGAAPGM
jgi:hypothetical protein